MVANYLECRTLTALIEPVSLSLTDSYLGASNLVKLDRARDRPLQLLVFNEEFLQYSKRKSSACVDYVPALCTHCPLLLQIKWLSEIFRLEC